MKSFSKLGGDPFSLALLTLLVLVLTPSDATATWWKETFLRNGLRRKLDDTLGGMKLGGYNPATEENAQQVADAASFAFEQFQAAPGNYSISAEAGASTEATSYKVTEAYVQVVAGQNIKMDMTFSDSSGACIGAATVVVYDQFGTSRSISSWDPIDRGCAVEAAVDNSEVVATASFAFETLQSNSTYGLSTNATSYEVTSASILTKEVSGFFALDIKMDMTFLDSLGACISTATVVVYDQFGIRSLTSYEPTDGCSPLYLIDVPSRPVMAGGYQDVPVDNENVATAASVAFETLQSNSTYGLSTDATSYKVTSASSQVVAGSNYKMDMTFLDSLGACISTATVVVYDQFGTMSLTSYEPTDGCPTPLIDDVPSRPTPLYSPKSTCESMGITNAVECDARCDKYFPTANPSSFGPFVDKVLQHPSVCMCKHLIGADVLIGDRYVCGATTDVRFTCADVNVTDVNTCDDVCKQDTSTPGTTFHGGWNEEHSMCECLADVPNVGVFNYCGGPPQPPASGVLPTCGSMAVFSEDACDNYCRDYMLKDYPQFQQFHDTAVPGGGIQCLCSTGAGCKDEVSPSPSSGNKLGAWVSSLMMLTATVMATAL